MYTPQSLQTVHVLIVFTIIIVILFYTIVVGPSLSGPPSSQDSPIPPVISLGNAAHTKLQNCKEFLNDGLLRRSWNDYHSSEISSVPLTDYGKEKGLIRTLLARRKTTRISGRDPILIVEEYVCWQMPQLIVCAHKFEDAIRRKYLRVSCVFD